MYEIFLKVLQEYPFFAIYVVKRPEKAQFPCLSDECLITQNPPSPLPSVSQPVTRKFTLAGAIECEY